jgi:hypothetical protein
LGRWEKTEGIEGGMGNAECGNIRHGADGRIEGGKVRGWEGGKVEFGSWNAECGKKAKESGMDYRVEGIVN